MIVNNGYSKGLNRDISVDKYDNNHYYDALNGRVVTEEGSTTFSFTNEKGNVKVFDVPNTGAIYKLTGTSAGDDFTIEDIDTTTTRTVSLTCTTIDEMYAQLSSLFAGEIAANQFALYNKGSFVLFVSLDNRIEVTAVGLTVEEVVPAQEDLKIIGYGNVQDWVVVFTTNATASNPVSYGQVWKTDMNSSLLPSNNLVFNNKLNLSVANPILDTEQDYVSEDYAKIYWADGYNNLRHINILDPNSLAASLGSVEILGNVDVAPPLITFVSQGGSYKAGMIQYAYQLYGSSGSETGLSPSTPLFHITASNEQSNALNYKGIAQDALSGKSFQVSITDIDDSYEFIKVWAVHYEDQTADPSVNVVLDAAVPDNRIVRFFDDGNNIVESKTVAEYNISANVSFAPRTITSKDSRLITANIKEDIFDIDYDARAYSFPPNSVVTTIDNQNLSSSSWSNKAFNDDCVNASNNTTLGAQKYQINSAIIGGSGPNVSYKFDLEQIVLDDTPTTAWKYDRAFPGTNSVDLGYKVLENPSYDNYASPWFVELKGYRRGEVMPFSIVFIDEKGRNSFSKWIADVRFPEAWEQNGENLYGQQFFPLSKYDAGDGVTYGYVLGVKFNVTNIPTNPNTGQPYDYKIVRTERTDQDKTVLATGLLHQTVDVSGFSQSAFFEYIVNSSNSSTLSRDIWKVYSPEFNFFNSDEAAPRFNVSPSYIKVDGYAPDTEYDSFTISGAGYTNNERLFKIKATDYTEEGLQPTIKAWQVLDDLGESKLDGTNIRNFNPPSGGWNGGVGMFIDIDGNFSSLSSIPLAANPFIVISLRRSLTNQYGGNTYGARTRRINIDTGAYVKGGDKEFRVFGGDTYLSYFSYSISSAAEATSDYLGSRTIFIPLESSVNTSMQRNKLFKSSTNATLGYDAKVKNQYNYTYSRENNLRNSFPKPLEFKNLSVFTNRIRVSNKKVTGENIDSWLKFDENEFREVDSKYGPISKIINHRNSVVFYQHDAMGVIGINERQLLTAETGSELVLGTGNVIGDPGYISTTTGCQHTLGVVATDSRLYHIDANLRKLYYYNHAYEKPLSDVLGISALLRDWLQEGVRNGDKNTFKDPFNLSAVPSGLTSVYDPINNRVIFTVLDTRTTQNPLTVTPVYNTISYNELINAFESRHSYTPLLFHRNGWRVFSTSIDNECHEHNIGVRAQYYGTTYDSYAEHFVMGVPSDSKLFTNSEFDAYVSKDGVDIVDEGVSQILCYNEHQTTGVVTPKSKRRWRTWRVVLPRVQNTKARLRGTYMKIRLIYNNNDDKKFVLRDVRTGFKQKTR